MSKIKTAVAVVAFAGTQDLFAFHVTGPEVLQQNGEVLSPATEVERLVAYLDMRGEDMDPFSLSVAAANMFDAYVLDYRTDLDLMPEDIIPVMNAHDVAVMRTI